MSPKQFSWDRWTRAERKLSKLRGKAAKKQESVCAFWRSIYNRYEAQEGFDLDHAATARSPTDPTYTRPQESDLLESLPDLPYANMLLPGGPL